MAAPTCFGLQVIHVLCRHNSDNVRTTSVSTLNQTCIFS